MRKTLPACVACGLATAATSKDLTGVQRAVAIVAGLFTTGAGYLAGDLEHARTVGLASSLQRARSLRVLAPLLTAVALWLTSLHGVRLDRMTDLGLVSVLPATYWIALALLLVSAAVLLHRPRAPQWALACHLVVLIVMLHGTPTLLYGLLRYGYAWKHIGIVDYIIRHGAVNPEIGNLAACHSWPGFFSLNAFLTQASGFSSALSYASWAPPVNQLLYLPLLVLIFRTVTTDQRRVWLGLLLFYLGDWLGQEYFSPRGSPTWST